MVYRQRQIGKEEVTDGGKGEAVGVMSGDSSWEC